MTLPTTDLEHEEEYREVLAEFIRPARLMFGGSFAEIRRFYSRLRETQLADLYIASGRYGLIPSETEIVPYQAPIAGIGDVEELESRHQVSDSMLEVLSKFDSLILSLPSYYIQFLVRSGWFDSAAGSTGMIVVCASKFRLFFSKRSGIAVLDRTGVARLGKKNQAVILDLLSRESII